MTGSRIRLTEDEQMIDAKNLRFWMSPHEECALEEAVRIAKARTDAGETCVTKVLTLGPADATDQIRHGMAMGMQEGILIETDGSDWDPMATSKALLEAIEAEKAAGIDYDLILMGNESADSGGFQIGVRLAHALGRPMVTGIKKIDFDGGNVIAQRETTTGFEIYEVPLPAVLGVKEGLNLPRYPSVPGRLKAKRKKIPTMTVENQPGGPDKIRLKNPPATEIQTEMLGEGAAAAPRIVDILEELGAI
ncbi:MAG: electron transfer flavoprotein beta subunit [Cellvibrionaceae bacterium]|jgi:electron transfer flavoprotein beta subunit